MKSRAISVFTAARFLTVCGCIVFSISSALALLALSVNSTSTAVAASKFNNGVKVLYPDHHDVSLAMRDVEPWPVQRVQEHEASLGRL